MGNIQLKCKVCGKEFLRHESEHKRNKTGKIYCSRECRLSDLKGESNPNFSNHWSDELKQSQSVKLKTTFANGRKVWNKGLDKSQDPRLAKCGVIGNDYGKYSKGGKRPDNIWRNVLNSAGVRFCLEKIHKYKYHAEFWLRLRGESLKRDGYKCQLCGKANGRLEVHHKIPTRMGGSDDLDNLITLCSICHKREEENARKCATLDGCGHCKNG